MSGPTVQSIEELARTAADELQEINTQESLQEWRVAYLGRPRPLDGATAGPCPSWTWSSAGKPESRPTRPSKIWNNG